MSKLKLNEYDLKSHIQKKPTFRKDTSGKLVPTDKNQWLDYVEWSVIWEILNNEYETVDFSSSKHPDFPNTLIIYIVLNETKYTMNYPIINGNAVIAAPTQMDIHKAELRGFVKAAAKYTGLGLSLWQKDESISDSTVKEKPALITAKTIKSLNTIKALTETWNTLDAVTQNKFKDVFSERKKEIEDGF